MVLEKEMYPHVENFLKDKCIPEYVGREQTVSLFGNNIRADICGIDSAKNVYLAEGKVSFNRRNFDECKMQAKSLQRFADYAYLFFPEKNWERLSESNKNGMKKECEDEGLGLLIVNTVDGRVEEVISSQKNNPNTTNKDEAILRIFFNRRKNIIELLNLQLTYENGGKYVSFQTIYNEIQNHKDAIWRIDGGKHRLNERGIRGVAQKLFNKRKWLEIASSPNRDKYQDFFTITEEGKKFVSPPILSI